ncbi:MAG: LacI family DNA-binding transcriptional regulator [Balneolaceae bacterium]|nr:LacI family DNA-binding transcriptional regulator [Balneolaceae bacterium]
MKVTLKDIAEETGYSISTVSRVLNGSDKISSQTRKIIIHTAKKLNYPIYYDQRGKNPLDSLNVFLVVSGFHVGEFYASLFAGIQQAAEEKNVQLSLLSINKSLNSLINNLKQLARKQQSDGLILFTPEFTKIDYCRIREELPDRFPLVSNGLIENPVFTTVSFDSYSGGYLAAEHFQQRGYTSCGIIRGPFKKAEARYRANGFRDFILQESDMDIVWEYNGDFSYESGSSAFNSFRDSSEKPRAIFSSSDAMCHGFMEEALLNDICFPGDVAIVGFDDLPICRRHRPTISSIHTDYKKLGEVTMEHIREIVSNPDQQKGVLSLVPVTLNVRDSS